MQDQPRYEVYEPSKSFTDGQSSRPLVEGTVARGQLRDNALLYTGKPPGGAALTSAPSGTRSAGGVGAAQPNAPAGTGAVNVRGNAAGGIVRATGVAGSNTNASVEAGPDIFPFPITAEDLQRGRTRFEQICAVCHGLTGNGDGMIVRRGFRKPPSYHEDRLQEGQTPASHFFDVVTNGWGAMPDYAAQIAVEDRWKIIAYVRALQLSRRATIADVPADKRGQLSAPAAAPAAHGGATSEHGGGEH